jgi:hypothetical protein
MPKVEGYFRDHLRGVHDYSGILWKCLVLETWLRHFERGFQMPDSSSSFMHGPAGERRNVRAAPSPVGDGRCAGVSPNP